VLPVTDAMVVSRNADAVILVAAVGSTSRRQVARATELLRQVGAPLTGAVLNRAGDVELYGYGYGYGQEAPEEPGRRARRQGKKAARSAGR
jgi:Mrp family chromosome partitioning ATPase